MPQKLHRCLISFWVIFRNLYTVSLKPKISTYFIQAGRNKYEKTGKFGTRLIFGGNMALKAKLTGGKAFNFALN